MRVSTTEGNPIVVSISGEVDFGNSTELMGALSGIVSQGHTAVDLDMSDTEYIDSSGVRVLLEFRRVIVGKGGRVAIRSVSDGVLGPLSHLGLLEMFGLPAQHPTVRNAEGSGIGRPGSTWLVSSFSVPGERPSAAFVRKRIKQVISDLPVSTTQAADILCAVGEAVSNAVKHGSAEGNGSVSVHCIADDSSFVVEISDSGPGFDPSTLRDGGVDSLPTGGMGIAIMRCVMDEMDFRFGAGTTVRLVKYLGH